MLLTLTVLPFFVLHRQMTSTPTSTPTFFGMDANLAAAYSSTQDWVSHLYHESIGDADGDDSPKVSKSYRQVRTDIANTTLALLYPPGLLGGYRNQVMRFTALVLYAKRQKLDQLYLPSVVWNTQARGNSSATTGSMVWYPIPMEMVFDVEYWNNRNNVAQSDLPLLVSELQNSDCWSPYSPAAVLSSTSLRRNNGSTAVVSPPPMHPLQRETLRQGWLQPIHNVTIGLLTNRLVSSDELTHPEQQQVFNLRRNDMLPLVEHCRHPVVYGGGIMAGRLWKDYLAASKKDQNRQEEQKETPEQSQKSSSLFQRVQTQLLQSLRPAPHWQEVAEDYCLQHLAGDQFLALHARIELEMMGHACGVNMERNLTRLLEHVGDFLENRTAADSHKEAIEGIFVAVSRDGMHEQGSSRYSKFQNYADENIQTLDRYTRGDVVNRQRLRNKYSILECGNDMMKRYYRDHPNVMDHGTLVEQAINFDVAVRAAYFIGVKGSSYSTDVWTTRYHAGKGDSNFEYTPTGIYPVENGGLPEPHGNCREKVKASSTK